MQSIRIHIILPLWIMGLTLARPAKADIVGWWSFDEGAGTTVADSSGKDHHGTLNGTAQWVAGKLGGALQFNGSGNYLNCGRIDVATAGTGAISVCAWINRSAAGDHKLCSNRQVANAAGGGFTCTLYNNRMEMDLSDATGRVLSRDASRPTVPGVGTWVHLAWVLDDAADTLKLYMDGALTTTATVTQSIGVSTQFFRIGADSPTLGLYFNGMVDDLRVYDHALGDSEIVDAMKGLGPGVGLGAAPNPADQATDVFRDAVLSWRPGKFAAAHDVYLGTAFEDVNTATRDVAGGTQVSRGQDANSFDPAGLFAYGQTYYWRVDEINAPPTDSTIFKGRVWSFTTEPYGYPVKPAKATASSTLAPGMGPEKTIDGSGLDAMDRHSTSASHMWVSKKGTGPIWIQYDFDAVTKLHQMWVWNSNQSVESTVGFGARDVTVETSADGVTWTALTGVPEFNQASGEANYTYNTVVDFHGVLVKAVKLTIRKNWADSDKQGSLSEVRFFYVPAKAVGPTPATGASAVALDAVLNWRPGREAVKHQVFLSTDPNAVAHGTALVATVNEHRLGLGSLGIEYGRTYYWKVNEVNDAATPAVWEGDVWTFSTLDYSVVDDFESYNDLCSRIFFTWVDGYGYSDTPECGVQAYAGNGSGSAVGNASPPFAEQTMIHAGRQAMPLFYDNTGKASSETERTFAMARDWTRGGAKTLVFYFAGVAGNGEGQLYVKVNGTKALYDGDLLALVRGQWRQWSVDLASLGVDLASVRSLDIGISGSGKGTLYVDDIRLYRAAPVLPQPVKPSATGLLARYTFEQVTGTTVPDVSGNKNDATVVSDAHVEGGQLVLDGVDDVVQVPRIGGAAAVYSEATYSMWVNPSLSLAAIQYAGGLNTDGWAAGCIHFKLSYGQVNMGINGGGADVQGKAVVQPNEWSHIAMTLSQSEISVYVYGNKEASRAQTPLTNLILGGGCIGGWANPGVQRTMPGRMDDVRIYNRALSDSEILGLANNL